MAHSSERHGENGKRPTVAVVGRGPVGLTLALALSRNERVVTVATRSPGAAASTEVDASLHVAAIGEALAAASVVILAIPGTATRSFLDEHAALLAHKIVIDATNDLSHGHAPGTLSSLPYLSLVVPEALGYRAFNLVGFENMAEPRFGTTVADLFYAGPDTAERDVVATLIEDVGFRPVYVGSDANAFHAVDSLATLWFALAFGQHHGRRLAFRMLGADDDAATV